MTDDSVQYFKRRAEEEGRRSREASDPRAAQAHADLAARYDEMAERFRPDEKGAVSSGWRKRLVGIFRFRSSDPL